MCLTSTAIFLPSFSAANTFSAPRSISSLMRSLRMVNGSLVIVYPSLMRASLTVSWKMSLAKLLYFLVKKNLIAKGEGGRSREQEGTRVKGYEFLKQKKREADDSIGFRPAYAHRTRGDPQHDSN